MKVFKSLKKFFGLETNVITKLMAEYNVKTVEELFLILEEKAQEKIRTIVAKELQLNPLDFKEFKLILNLTYSDTKFDLAKKLILKGDKENLILLENPKFNPTADYLRVYQVFSKNSKVYIIAIVFPYEPYQQNEVIWIQEVDEKLF